MFKRNGSSNYQHLGLYMIFSATKSNLRAERIIFRIIPNHMRINQIVGSKNLVQHPVFFRANSTRNKLLINGTHYVNTSYNIRLTWLAIWKSKIKSEKKMHYWYMRTRRTIEYYFVSGSKNSFYHYCWI